MNNNMDIAKGHQMPIQPEITAEQNQVMEITPVEGLPIVDVLEECKKRIRDMNISQLLLSLKEKQVCFYSNGSWVIANEELLIDLIADTIVDPKVISVLCNVIPSVIEFSDLNGELVFKLDKNLNDIENIVMDIVNEFDFDTTAFELRGHRIDFGLNKTESFTIKEDLIIAAKSTLYELFCSEKLWCNQVVKTFDIIKTGIVDRGHFIAQRDINKIELLFAFTDLSADDANDIESIRVEYNKKEIGDWKCTNYILALEDIQCYVANGRYSNIQDCIRNSHFQNCNIEDQEQLNDMASLYLYKPEQ